MRLIVAAALIVSCLAGVALAQQSEAFDTSNIQWEQAPELREVFVRYIPDRAMREEVSGAALVCCTFDRRRRLNCEVARETQEGYGFGQATIRIMRLYRVSETSYAEWQAASQPRISRTMRWYVGEPTPELHARLAEFGESVRGVCTAPPAEQDSN